MTIPMDAPPEPEVRMVPRYVCPRCGIELEDPDWYGMHWNACCIENFVGRYVKYVDGWENLHLGRIVDTHYDQSADLDGGEYKAVYDCLLVDWTVDETGCSVNMDYYEVEADDACLSLIDGEETFTEWMRDNLAQAVHMTVKRIEEAEEDDC